MTSLSWLRNHQPGIGPAAPRASSVDFVSLSFFNCNTAGLARRANLVEATLNTMFCAPNKQAVLIGVLRPVVPFSVLNAISWREIQELVVAAPGSRKTVIVRTLSKSGLSEVCNPLLPEELETERVEWIDPSFEEIEILVPLARPAY